MLNTETVGCCLGTFSALVVSSSSSWAQICHNAAAVVRAVFVLGALSDAHDAIDASGPSISLIAFWRGGQLLFDLRKALKNCPEVCNSTRKFHYPRLPELILTYFGMKGIYLCLIRREQGYHNNIHSHSGCFGESPSNYGYYNQ